MKKIQEKLQSFSGAMMVPIILLVLVGFYVGVGSAFTNYILPQGGFLHAIFSMFESMGFAFMNNLPILFAIGISFSLAKKEKGWAAFGGFVMFLSYITCIGSFANAMGFNATTTTVESLVTNLGYVQADAMNFSAIWGNVLGIFTYNMGIFSGIIAGVSTGIIHNKFCETKFIPTFAFFQGTKFVIIMITIISVPLAIATYYVWPIIASGLQGITAFIGSSGLFGTFIFGFMDKALLPLGIHHLIAFPIEYSSVGGTMMIDGVLYEGVRNIINGQAASSEATGYLVRNFTSGRILFQLAGLPGAALAIYHCAKLKNRKKVASLLVPTLITLMLVGVSEPIEYTFLFVAPMLYWLIYAPLCGICYVLAEIAQISINGHALFFMIPNLFQPDKVHAMSLIVLLPAVFITYYYIFKFVIKKFNLKTPGRNDDDEEIKLMSKKEYNKIKDGDSSLEVRIVEAFGGIDNITSVTCCATRLRVIVKDETIVASDNQWKNNLEAIGVVKSGKAYQIIYGVHVNSITTSVKDILGMD